jgi:MFS family permease
LAQQRGQVLAILGASVAGAVFGAGMVTMIAFAVFLQTMQAEFHTDRAGIALAVTVLRVTAALAGLAIGHAIDALGVRRVVLPLTVVSALAVAAIGLVPGNLVQLYGAFALVGLVAPGITPYSKLLSGWFTARRGIALASFGTGIFVCAALTPQIARVLMVHFGWRHAFVALALIIVATLPILLLFLRENPAVVQAPKAAQTGVAAAEALRNRDFWTIVLALGASLFTYNGLMAHDVALFQSRGADLAAATTLASEIAIGGGVAQLLVGWALDRFDTPRVILPFAIAALGGLLLIDLSSSPIAWTLGALTLGVGSGGETSMTTYYVSRYFGLKQLSRIYAAIGTITALTVSFSPVLIGHLYDRSQSYGSGLHAMELALGLAVIGFAALRPYRFTAA